MTILYQTLANNENVDNIEKNGPFKCESKTAWLGTGYYFWEQFIENAQWWGKQIHGGNYIICSSSYDRFSDDCLDLIDNDDDLKTVREFIEELKRKGKYTASTSLSRVIELFKNEFNIKAARINGIGSKRGSFEDHKVYINKEKTNIFIDLMPPIQVCIYDKSILLKEFKVIYPIEYASDTLV